MGRKSWVGIFGFALCAGALFAGSVANASADPSDPSGGYSPGDPYDPSAPLSPYDPNNQNGPFGWNNPGSPYNPDNAPAEPGDSQGDAD